MFTLTELREAVNASNMEEDIKSDLIDILLDNMGYEEVDILFDKL